MAALNKVNFFEVVDHNRGLANHFTKVKASDENLKDLLNFRKIGEEEYQLRIRYFLLKQPSIEAPNRKKAL